MADRTLLTVYVPSEAEQRARDMAAAQGISVSALLRRALGLMQVFDEATQAGHYVGTTRIREHLDQVIVAPL